ncbi:MAG: hypothetical protein ACOYNN_01190 [Terrimicrobiaceae bacterium]
MKTTVDLPEELVYRAKIAAAQRKTTLKELVVLGLDYAISHPHPVTDPETQSKERASKLLELLGRIQITEPIGKWSREEVYDRNQGKWE